MKRPLPHHFIIVSYIATPLVNLALVSLSLGIPLQLAAGRVLAGYGPLVAAWLATAPVAGACLYLLNRASWYIFLVHAGISFRGRHDHRSALARRCVRHPSAFPSLVSRGNVIRIAFVGYVLQRDVRAPYFHILQRSFRAARRLSLTVPIILDGEAFRTADPSPGGSFVARPAPQRGAGSGLASGWMRRTEVRCAGQVMRSSPTA